MRVRYLAQEAWPRCRLERRALAKLLPPLPSWLLPLRCCRAAAVAAAAVAFVSIVIVIAVIVTVSVAIDAAAFVLMLTH